MSPTAITLLAAASGIAAAAALFLRWQLAAVLLFALNRVLDGLDGLVARETGQQSDAGGYLDIVLDFLVYVLIPLSLTANYGIGARSWFLLSLLFAAFYLNGVTWMYLSALLEKRQMAGAAPTSLVMPRGLIEGTETILLFGLMLVFPRWLNTLLAAMAGLVLLGALIRFVVGFRVLRQSPPQQADSEGP